MADHTVLDAFGAADIASNDLAGIHGDPDTDLGQVLRAVLLVDATDCGLHVQCTGYGAVGMVGAVDWRAENGQDGVADEFINGATMTHNNIGHNS